MIQENNPENLRFVGIIPARYQSTRFPGKPLADIMGKPMFWHVYHRAGRCRLMQKIYLATDDARIYRAAQDLEVPVLMTSDKHQSGTDRIKEAALTLGLSREDVVVNIQGDEPALEPKMLDQLLEPFVSAYEINVTTLARKIDPSLSSDPNLVKVVVSQTGRALYFSRSKIPFSHSAQDPVLGHIGLYAYRMDCLEKFQKLGMSALEKAEKLEQLRLLEADIPIHVVLTQYCSRGVDVPEDISKVTRIIQEQQV